MRKAVWLIVTVLNLGLFDAYGQSSDLKVSVFGGGIFPLMGRTFTIDDADDFFTTGFRPGPRFGVRVGKDFSGWGIEGAYSYGRNNFRVEELQTPAQTRNFKMTNQHVSGNAMYYFGIAEDWKPFVTAGLGLVRFKPTQEAIALANVRFLDNSGPIQTDNEWAVNFGGGTEKKVSDSIGIRVDFHNHMVQIPRFGVRETSNGSGSGFYPVRGWGNNIEVSAGVVFTIPLR